MSVMFGSCRPREEHVGQRNTMNLKFGRCRPGEELGRQRNTMDLIIGSCRLNEEPGVQNEIGSRPTNEAIFRKEDDERLKNVESNFCKLAKKMMHLQKGMLQMQKYMRMTNKAVKDIAQRMKSHGETVFDVESRIKSFDRTLRAREEEMEMKRDEVEIWRDEKRSEEEERETEGGSCAERQWSSDRERIEGNRRSADDRNVKDRIRSDDRRIVHDRSAQRGWRGSEDIINTGDRRRADNERNFEDRNDVDDESGSDKLIIGLRKSGDDKSEEGRRKFQNRRNTEVETSADDRRITDGRRTDKRKSIGNKNERRINKSKDDRRIRNDLKHKDDIRKKHNIRGRDDIDNYVRSRSRHEERNREDCGKDGRTATGDSRNGGYWSTKDKIVDDWKTGESINIVEKTTDVENRWNIVRILSEEYWRNVDGGMIADDKESAETRSVTEEVRKEEGRSGEGETRYNSYRGQKEDREHVEDRGVDCIRRGEYIETRGTINDEEDAGNWNESKIMEEDGRSEDQCVIKGEMVGKESERRTRKKVRRAGVAETDVEETGRLRGEASSFGEANTDSECPAITTEELSSFFTGSSSVYRQPSSERRRSPTFPYSGRPASSSTVAQQSSTCSRSFSENHHSLSYGGQPVSSDQSPFFYDNQQTCHDQRETLTGQPQPTSDVNNSLSGQMQFFFDNQRSFSSNSQLIFECPQPSHDNSASVSDHLQSFYDHNQSHSDQVRVSSGNRALSSHIQSTPAQSKSHAFSEKAHRNVSSRTCSRPSEICKTRVRLLSKNHVTSSSHAIDQKTVGHRSHRQPDRQKVRIHMQTSDKLSESSLHHQLYEPPTLSSGTSSKIDSGMEKCPILNTAYSGIESTSGNERLRGRSGIIIHRSPKRTLPFSSRGDCRTISGTVSPSAPSSSSTLRRNKSASYSSSKPSLQPSTASTQDCFNIQKTFLYFDESSTGNSNPTEVLIEPPDEFRTGSIFEETIPSGSFMKNPANDDVDQSAQNITQSSTEAIQESVSISSLSCPLKQSLKPSQIVQYNCSKIKIDKLGRTDTNNQQDLNPPGTLDSSSVLPNHQKRSSISSSDPKQKTSDKLSRALTSFKEATCIFFRKQSSTPSSHYPCSMMHRNRPSNPPSLHVCHNRPSNPPSLHVCCNRSPNSPPSHVGRNRPSDSPCSRTGRNRHSNPPSSYMCHNRPSDSSCSHKRRIRPGNLPCSHACRNRPCFPPRCFMCINRPGRQVRRSNESHSCSGSSTDRNRPPPASNNTHGSSSSRRSGAPRQPQQPPIQMQPPSVSARVTWDDNTIYSPGRELPRGPGNPHLPPGKQPSTKSNQAQALKDPSSDSNRSQTLSPATTQKPGPCVSSRFDRSNSRHVSPHRNQLHLRPSRLSTRNRICFPKCSKLRKSSTSKSKSSPQTGQSSHSTGEVTLITNDSSNMNESNSNRLIVNIPEETLSSNRESTGCIRRVIRSPASLLSLEPPSLSPSSSSTTPLPSSSSPILARSGFSYASARKCALSPPKPRMTHDISSLNADDASMVYPTRETQVPGSASDTVEICPSFSSSSILTSCRTYHSADIQHLPDPSRQERTSGFTSPCDSRIPCTERSISKLLPEGSPSFYHQWLLKNAAIPRASRSEMSTNKNRLSIDESVPCPCPQRVLKHGDPSERISYSGLTRKAQLNPENNFSCRFPQRCLQSGESKQYVRDPDKSICKTLLRSENSVPCPCTSRSEMLISKNRIRIDDSVPCPCPQRVLKPGDTSERVSRSDMTRKAQLYPENSFHCPFAQRRLKPGESKPCAREPDKSIRKTQLRRETGAPYLCAQQLLKRLESISRDPNTENSICKAQANSKTDSLCPCVKRTIKDIGSPSIVSLLRNALSKVQSRTRTNGPCPCVQSSLKAVASVPAVPTGEKSICRYQLGSNTPVERLLGPLEGIEPSICRAHLIVESDSSEDSSCPDECPPSCPALINVGYWNIARHYPVRARSASCSCDLSRFDPASCRKRILMLGKILMSSAHKGNTSDVQKLLDMGAQVNFTNSLKWTPLHRAVAKAHADVAWLLLKRGADANARTSYGLTALHIAACRDRNGHTIARLVCGGADLNSWNRCGQTPLHTAAENGNIAAVAALVESGASVIAKDNDGRTPFDIAKSISVRKLLTGDVSCQE